MAIFDLTGSNGQFSEHKVQIGGEAKKGLMYVLIRSKYEFIRSTFPQQFILAQFWLRPWLQWN